MPRDEINRRSVLKQLGVVAAGGTTLAAAGSEAAEARQLEAQYYGREQLLEAFHTHGAGLPAALSEAGVVDETFGFGDVAFELDPEVRGMEPTEEDGLAGVTVTATDGPRTAVGMISTSTDGHEVALFVQPERNEAYAIVESADDGDRFVVTDDGSVEPLGCAYYSCTCERCYNPNGVMYYVEEYYECTADCTSCWLEDTSCVCTSCS